MACKISLLTLDLLDLQALPSPESGFPNVLPVLDLFAGRRQNVESDALVALFTADVKLLDCGG